MKNQKKINPPTARRKEKGSAFFYILLGVVLFGALAFTLSRGMRGSQTNMLSERQAELAATDILTYAKKVESAINRLRQKGCSEEQLSFENNVVTGYTNTLDPTGDNTCHIFHPDGAGLNWQSPPQGANDGSEWTFNARNVIEGVGCTAFGPVNGKRCVELAAFLNNMNLNVCEKLNDLVGLSQSTPPVDSNTTSSETQKFNGLYGSNDGISDTGTVIDGQHSLCFQEKVTPTPIYHFYHVLIER